MDIHPKMGLLPGMPIPEFELVDARTLKRVASSELQGCWSLLMFSSPDCKPCATLYEALELVHRRESGLNVVLLSRDTPAANLDNARSYGLTMRILLEEKWQLVRLFKLSLVPALFLVSPEGIVRASVCQKGPEPILEFLNSVAAGNGIEWQVMGSTA